MNRKHSFRLRTLNPRVWDLTGFATQCATLRSGQVDLIRLTITAKGLPNIHSPCVYSVANLESGENAVQEIYHQIGLRPNDECIVGLSADLGANY